MSIASSAFKRLCGLYRIVFRRMREHEARLFGGLGRLGRFSGGSAGGRLRGAASSRGFRIEQLEPRLLLDASGPQIIANWPTGLVQPVDHIDITFNEAIDPSTLTAGGVLIMRPSPVRLGGYDTTGQARGVAVSGTRAYVADYNSGLQILDISNPAAPVLLGGYDTTGSAMVVDLSGTRAYVADYSSGLQVLDITNPASPQRLGGYDTPGIAYGVAVSGSLAYVADFMAGLQIIDVSNPASPVRLGGYDTAGQARGVAVSGTLAYVADSGAGLAILDVSNPTAPVLLGTYDTAGSAYAVTLSGNLAYVADAAAGLQIIDVSNPAAPVLRGTYDTAGTAYGVTISGPLAYVADYDTGLQVLDVSNPSAPALLASYDTAGYAYGVAVSTGRAYVADGGAGLQIVEVHKPATGVVPVDATTYRVNLAGALSTGTYNVRVYPMVRNLAGNAMDQDGDGVGGELPDDVYTFSFTVDATPPTVPGNLAFADDTGVSAADGLTSDAELSFTWSAATDANGIARYEYRLDNGAWTATTDLGALVPFTAGQHTFEVRAVDGIGNASPSSALALTVDQTAPPAPTGLAVNGSVLSWAAATDANGIWKYQYRINGADWIDSAASPVDTGMPIGSGAVLDVRAVDRAGNVGPWSTVQQPDYGPRVVGHSPSGSIPAPTDHIDITFNEPINGSTFTPDDVQVIPSKLALRGSWYADSSYEAPGVAVSGTQAYVAYGYLGLYILDVSNPVACVKLGRYDTVGYASSVVLSGNYAYVADGSNGLQIIDVSNPAAPTLKGSYDTTGSATEVAVSGSLVYVADGNSGLQIINVSNPGAPVRLGGYDTSGVATGVVLSGTLAYVADGSSGLQIINVSNPAAPVRLGGYDTTGTALDVELSGTLAYVADDTGGLQIIDVSNPAAPVRLGGYAAANSAKRVAIAGTMAYVADNTNGLDVIDVADSSAPVRLGGYASSRAWGVCVRDTTAYVAAYYGGLQIIEAFRRPSSVTQISDQAYRIDLPGPLAEGTYHFRVGPDVADLAGNLMDQNADGVNGQPQRDKYAFSLTIDTQSPSAVTNLAFADNTGGSATDNVTSDTTLAFTWTAATDANGVARYDYRWDGGQWIATTALGVSIATVEGTHVLEVRAVDPAGNISPTVSRSVVVDTTAPMAPTSVRLDGAVLQWNAVAEANGIWKYQYRVNAGAWTDAAVNSASTGLAAGGSASFNVRAVDQAGNVGATASATLTANYGPRVIGSSPSGLLGQPVDHVFVTFNEPIDPATFTAQDVHINPATTLRVGGYDTPGNAYAVVVSGNLAYVADNYEGLRILNVSNPAAPVQVGYINNLGGFRDLEVVGNLAYVAAYDSGLRIINVSNPAAPVLVGTCPATGPAHGLDVVGNLVYMASSWGGLRIINVSNPAAPVQVGLYDTSDSAYDVQVVGTLAYVADFDGGLRIINVSNPAAPVEVGSYQGGAYAMEVQIVGSLAYVAEYNSSLRILDVSNPASPVQVGYREMSYDVEDLQVVGTLAYMANYGSGLRIIDVSNPVSPVEVVYYDTPGNALGVTVVGNLAYVADDTGGLQIIKVPRGDASGVTQVDATTWRIDMAAPLADGNYTINVGPGITDLAGNTMDQNANGVGGQYTADVYAFGLAVDQTPPTTPGTLTFADDTGASSSDKLTYDTTLTFTWTASTDLNGVAGYEYRWDGGNWTATTGLSASVTGGDGLHLFEVRAKDLVSNASPAASLAVTVDTTVPSAPTGLAMDGAVLSWTESSDANGIWKYQYRMNGGAWIDSTAARAATGLADGLTAIIDVRAVDKAGNAGAPATASLTADYGPYIVSRSPAGVTGPINSMTVTFNEPVAPSTFTKDDLRILLPTPKLIGSYITPGIAYDVAVSGNVAYVGAGIAGLYILDISNPAQPVYLGNRSTGGVACDLALVGNLLYVAVLESGVQIIDVSNSRAPVLVSTITSTGSAHTSCQSVTVAGNLLFTSDYQGGMHIYDVSNPASPVFVGSYGNGSAYDVALSGNYAFLAFSGYGLYVLDVSNPAAPVKVGSYSTGSEARSVTLRGSLAYMATNANGLLILDISNPAVPVRLGSYDTPGSCLRVTLSGDLAFVADYYSGLHIIDVSDPSAPALLRDYPSSSSTHAVAMSGDLAFMADNAGGVKVIQTFQEISSFTQVTGTTWRVDFPAPLAQGTYGLRIRPEIANPDGRVMDQNRDGVCGDASHDYYKAAIVVDTIPPPAPLSLALANDTGSAGDNITAATALNFAWSPPTDVAGIAGYNYRLDGGAWTSVSGTSATVSAAEGSHIFEVRAIDGAGNVGPAASLEVVVDLTAPAAPAGLRLDGAVLCWDAAADANGIWKYQYRPSGGNWADATGSSAATGLSNGASGSFDVRAVDKAGNIGPIANATLTAQYGPFVVAHWPAGQESGLTCLDIEFNKPILSSTFNKEDARIILASSVEKGFSDTTGYSYHLQVIGTLAYVADMESGLWIINVSNPAAPVQVGHLDTAGAAHRVQVVGKLAYVADGADGLLIIDVSNPSAPVQIGKYDTPYWASGLQVVGTLAYVADGFSGLEIIDISNPTTPVMLGSRATTGYAVGIQVVGNLAYLATEDYGLVIMNVTNPSSPVLVGSYNTPGICEGIAVLGNCAYLADRTGGLQIINVSNPAAPSKLGSVDTPGEPYDVQVVGTMAYVADSGGGMRIIDVANPADPLEVGVYAGATALSVQMVGTIAYVAGGDKGLRIVETSQSAQEIAQIDAYTYRAKFAGPLADGVHVFVVWPEISDQTGNTVDQDRDGVGGEVWDDVYLLKVPVGTTPPQPPQGLTLTSDTGSQDNVTSATMLAFTWLASSDPKGISGYQWQLDGGTWTSTAALSAQVQAGEGAHRFWIRAVDSLGNTGIPAVLDVAVDLTAPGAPTGLGINGAVLHWDEPADTNGIWKYQYRVAGGAWKDARTREALTGLANGSAATLEVRAVDKAGNVGPAAAATLTANYGPRAVSHSPDGLTGPVTSLTVRFNEPIDPATLTAQDVQIALPAPVRLANWAGGIPASTESGNLLYTVSSAGLKVFDVSNPAAPVQLGICALPAGPADVVVVDNLAYVADGSAGLQIVDVSNPAKPVLIGSCATVESATRLAVSGNFAFVVVGRSGMQIINISNSAAPAVVGNYDNDYNPTRDVAISGNFAYLAVGYTMDVVDVSNPAAPVRKTVFNYTSDVANVAVSGKFLYVTTYADGLIIYDISDPANPHPMGKCYGVDQSKRLVVSGTMAYAVGLDGFHVFDIHDPSAPVHVSGLFTGLGNCSAMAVAGEYAYVLGSTGSAVFSLFQPMAGITGITQVDDVTYRINLDSSLADGTYHIRIGPGITDLAGNVMDQDANGAGGKVSSDMFAFAFTTDKTAPTAPTDLALTNDTGSADGVTTATTLAFSWSPASDANSLAGYEYRLDGGAWIWTVERLGQATAAEGPHTIEVRAVDGAGNRGPAAALAVAVDLTAPAAPSGLRLDGAVLHWNEPADANGIWKYQYRINGGNLATTADRQVLTGLAVGGQALFEIRALDKAGNVGPWGSATLTADYGPRVTGYLPAGVVGPTSALTLTFNEPLDPATLTADDIRQVLPSPTRLGSCLAPSTNGNIALSDNLAFVAASASSGSGWLQIVDVSNPSAPVEVGRASYSESFAGVAASGNLAFAADDFYGLHVYDVSNPAKPIHMSIFDTSGTALEIVPRGNLLYTANGDGFSLQIIDVSNPVAPSLKGQYAIGAYALSIAVSGNLAYVTDAEHGLNVIDISNTVAPVRLVRTTVATNAYDVAVSGNIVYLADDTVGLVMVDVSNPSAPVVVGTYDTPGSAWRVAISGTVAYVADKTGGLQVIDVSNPAAPIYMGSYAGSVYGVAVSGDKVYVSRNGSLEVLDMMRPLANVAGVTRLGGSTYRVDLTAPLSSGAYYICVGPLVTDPAGNTMDQDRNGVGGQTPDDMYSFNFTVDATLPSMPGNLKLANDTGASGSDGLTAETALTFTWSAATGTNGIAGYQYRLDGGGWALTAGLSATVSAGEGSHVFEVRAVDGLGKVGGAAIVGVVVDTTAPAAPGGLEVNGSVLSWAPASDANGIWKYQYRVNGGGWIDTAGTSVDTGVAVGSGAVFNVRAWDRAGNAGPLAAVQQPDYGPRVVSHWPDGLVGPVDHVDLTFNESINPSTLTADDVRILLPAPLSVGAYDSAGYAYGVAVSGTTAYLADENRGLAILDVSNPAAPVLLGGYDTTGYAHGVAVAGNRAYVADYAAGLQIIDVSNLSAPQRLGGYDTSGYAYGVAVAGTLAYVADYSAGLQIIDVSNPSAPQRLGGYNTAGFAFGVAVSGTLAYVADGSKGLAIIDVSNPAAPQKIGGLDTAGSAMGVAVYGTLAFVADYTAGLQVIDVSNPSAPVLVGTYDTAGAAYGVTVSGPLAFVADYGAGLVVLDVSNPSAPRRVAGLDTPGAARAVAVSGTRAYVADETAGLQIINVLDEVSGVMQTGELAYRIDLPGALADGEHHVFVGPDVTDLAGNAMDQNANGIGGQTADALGFSFTTSTASPAPAVPSVAGRHVFYNNSAWDVGNSVLNAADPVGAASDADDGAIAAGVSALLPGQIAGPENRTAFSRGINGVMVDVANMFAGGLTAADFTFRVGAGGDASAWRAAPAPAGVTVRAGAGDSDSSRVTITWPDGAIVGCWLEVTVLSDANGGHAGLGADDVFCFGNLPGDFNRDGSVDAADYIALKQAFGSRTTSADASADFDGSGAVDYGDLLTLMGSFGQRFVAAFCPPALALAPSTATPTATMTPTAPATAMAAPDPAAAGQAPAIVNDPDAELAAAEPVASEAAAGTANQAVLTADEAISTANQVVLTANDAVLPADQPIATADDRGRVDANADVLAMSAAAALADTQPALTVPTSEGSTILNLAEAGAPLPSKLPGVSLPAKLAGLLQPSLGAVAVTAGNFDVLAGLTTAPALSEMSLGTDGAFAVDLLLLRPVDLDVLPSPL